MHTQKAISIVLIPPPEIINDCTQKNRKDFEGGFMPISLGADDFIPHITLFMGIAYEPSIAHISAILDKLSQKHLPIKLEPTKVAKNWMFFKKTPTLLDFQQSIANEVEPLVHHKALADHYFTDPEDIITPDCFPWVEKFYYAHSFENFAPHITTWSTYEGPPPNTSFVAADLALCHMGKYNTCRRILWKN
ncbi:hypothetical protein H6758_04375 [Candidatus Nomurabacteria bacterium]|nr:hypothetical protein [Candidatus Nomurabacteria bacterium]